MSLDNTIKHILAINGACRSSLTDELRRAIESSMDRVTGKFPVWFV